jgi:hypothetical protein
MLKTAFAPLLIALTISPVFADLPVRLDLDFDNPADYAPSDWHFVAPTPPGVVQADPNDVVSVADGHWNWSIDEENHVLVGIYPGLALTNSSIETTFNFDAASDGVSLGFLNRFGEVGGLAHGYCVLTGPSTITLIDFDFARDSSEYVRAIDQVATPVGLLLEGEPNHVFFQVIDGPSSADASQIVPHFEYTLNGTSCFERVEDWEANCSSGWAGVDVWTVDPFAAALSDSMHVQYDSIIIRGVPEPGTFAFVITAATMMTAFDRKR